MSLADREAKLSSDLLLPLCSLLPLFLKGTCKLRSKRHRIENIVGGVVWQECKGVANVWRADEHVCKREMEIKLIQG